MYLVSKIMRSIEIQTLYGAAKVMLKDDDGMIGACPVFNTREEAEKYADGAKVLEIEYAKIL